MPAEHEGGGESGQAQPYDYSASLGDVGARRGKGRHQTGPRESAGRIETPLADRAQQQPGRHRADD